MPKRSTRRRAKKSADTLEDEELGFRATDRGLQGEVTPPDPNGAARVRSARRRRAKPATNENARDKKRTDTLEDEERAFRATDRELQGEATLSDPGGSARIPEPEARNDAGDDAGGASHPHRFVPLRMGGDGGTHKPTADSRALVAEIGGLPALEEMTGFFYGNAFRDATLDKFIRSHDDPHARRFALWIYQKLTGKKAWDSERRSRPDEPVEIAGGKTTVVHDRTSAHAAAWHSPKRPRREVGRRFKLDECRVWMRLHLWAMREKVAGRSPSFADYYVRFIGHFISVYESTAPAFARDSYRWSASPGNIQGYLKSGRRMEGVVGVSPGKVLQQIPEDEAEDPVWPYVGAR